MGTGALDWKVWEVEAGGLGSEPVFFLVIREIRCRIVG